jgi:hypothetical protein
LRQTIWKPYGADDVRQDHGRRAVNGELEGIGQVFARVLGVLEEALEARGGRAGKDGEPVDFGPDHHARLTAEDRSSSC